MPNPIVLFPVTIAAVVFLHTAAAVVHLIAGGALAATVLIVSWLWASIL